jgi:hypothetical protein
MQRTDGRGACAVVAVHLVRGLDGLWIERDDGAQATLQHWRSHHSDEDRLSSLAVRHAGGERMRGSIDENHHGGSAWNHAGGPLGEGCLDSNYIVFPWHHWKFHRVSSVGEPGFEEGRVPSFPVEVEHGRVLVNLRASTRREASSAPSAGAPGCPRARPAATRRHLDHRHGRCLSALLGFRPPARPFACRRQPLASSLPWRAELYNRPKNAQSGAIVSKRALSSNFLQGAQAGGTPERRSMQALTRKSGWPIWKPASMRGQLETRAVASAVMPLAGACL